jgi:hypothetical protein
MSIDDIDNDDDDNDDDAICGLPQSTSALFVASKSSHFVQCLTCKKIKALPDYLLVMCKSCCTQMLDRCKILYYQCDKNNHAPPANTDMFTLERIQDAIHTRTDMWILYDMEEWVRNAECFCRAK